MASGARTQAQSKAVAASPEPSEEENSNLHQTVSLRLAWRVAKESCKVTFAPAFDSTAVE